MNIESLNAALVSLLNKAVSVAEQGGQFLAEQLPDVIQQLLMWKMVASILLFLLALSVFGISLWGFKRIHKHVQEQVNSYEPHELLYGVPLMGFLASAFLCDVTWLKILLAPKVYLIEYAASLVK